MSLPTRLRVHYAVDATILVIVLTLGLTAWAQQPEHRDDRYQDDPNAFCRKGPEDPGDSSAHSCACSLMCSDGTEAEPSHQMENTSCSMYCSRQRCLCHVDNNCDKAQPL